MVDVKGSSSVTPSIIISYGKGRICRVCGKPANTINSFLTSFESSPSLLSSKAFKSIADMGIFYTILLVAFYLQNIIYLYGCLVVVLLKFHCLQESHRQLLPP
jgi:uncharacterized membrane protein YozB (DUF420 family)